MKVWWVWEVGLAGEGKEGRRRDAGAIAEESRRSHSAATPTSPEGYAAKGASAALPRLDDAQWHRLRRAPCICTLGGVTRPITLSPRPAGLARLDVDSRRLLGFDQEDWGLC